VYGDNSPQYSIIFRDGFLEEFLQDFPTATAEVRKQLSIIEEIPTEDFGYAEDKVPVGYGLEDFLIKPLAKFHHPFLVAGLPWCDELYFEIKIQVLW
jgi:hypothetical protein